MGADIRARGCGFASSQVLSACKLVFDLNLVLASRDVLGSHLTLALPSECYQRPHNHGLTSSFIDRSIVTVFAVLALHLK